MQGEDEVAALHRSSPCPLPSTVAYQRRNTQQRIILLGSASLSLIQMHNKHDSKYRLRVSA